MKRALFAASLLFLSTAGSLPAETQPNTLEALSDAVQQLARHAAPSVLQVVTEGFGEAPTEGAGNTNVVSRQTGVASCVAVSAEGDLITNAHVLNGARRVRVRLHSDKPDVLVDVDITGVDRETDLALLKLHRPTPHFLELADSSQVRQGQLVFALGNPQALENSVSMGVVSAVSRGFGADASQTYLQTDAPINPGNSGGPLLNTRGQVVGIDTFILTESGGSEGLGFAIPSNMVRDVYAQLKKYGRVRRGEIGAAVRSVTPSIAAALNLPRQNGVLVQDVTTDGPADDAGLLADDIIVAVEGRTVRNVNQLSDGLFRSAPGEKLTLDVVRGTQRLKLPVSLVEHKDETGPLAEQVRQRSKPLPQLGVLVMPLEAGVAGALSNLLREGYGSVVAAKLQTTSTVREELEVGDIVVGVNGKPAPGVAQLQEMLNGVPESSPLVIRLQRGDVMRYVLIRGD